MKKKLLGIATMAAALVAHGGSGSEARADEPDGGAPIILAQAPRPRDDTTDYSVYYRGKKGGWHYYSSTRNKRRAEDVANMLEGRGYKTYIDDGRQTGLRTSAPRGPSIPMPPVGDGSSRAGNDPPGALRSVEPDVITGRSTGFRRTDPEVRSRPSRERLVMDPNAPKSQAGNGSTATPALRSKSQTRPAAPSSRPVRRPQPDAPTGFPGLNQRTTRPTPSSTPDRRAQQKPRDVKRQSKEKNQQRRSSPPSSSPPFFPPFQGGHG